MTGISEGIVSSVVAGIVNGSFAAPTKYTSRWRWENVWAVWAITALLVVPWAAAFATVPGLLSFYTQTSWGLLDVLVGLGLGVGISQIFFALALAEVGLSIGFAVTIGLSTAIGALLPMLMLDPSLLGTHAGAPVLAGVGFILAGTATCAISSNRKDKEQSGQVIAKSGRRRFWRGLWLCILAGILAPSLNVALTYGAPLVHRAAYIGVAQGSRTNVVWPPVLTATMVPFLVYCIYLWRKNNSWRLYSAPGTGHYWLPATLMGVLWTGSVILYGYSSTSLGQLGPVLGWPLFMSVIIITSNAWGFVTGEWKGTSRQTLGIMLGGILLLVLGFCAVAVASAHSFTGAIS